MIKEWLDISTLPDGTIFNVIDGHWTGYVTTENNQKVCYSGVDIDHPTAVFSRKFIVNPGTKNYIKLISVPEKYDIALYEIPICDGLTREQIHTLMDKLKNDTMYPIEIEGGCMSTAMGFILNKAAENLDYDYVLSGLNDFIANILDDMNDETETCEYEFKGLKIWMSR